MFPVTVSGHDVFFPRKAQAPPQPSKIVPTGIVAVRVTSVPLLYFCSQSAPQAMPVPVTVPRPVLATVSVPALTKLAFTVRAAAMATLHAPLRVQAPVHLSKSVSGPGMAVRLTTVPFG